MLLLVKYNFYYDLIKVVIQMPHNIKIGSEIYKHKWNLTKKFMLNEQN